MYSVIGILILGLLSSIGSVPVEERSQIVDTSFIAKGTNELATALLQGFVQKEENMVYSPFGYSAILAIFSEGARGVSREEIANALYFPQDIGRVRQAYNAVLERFVAKRYSNSPEFKNWFYIYKNYTVEEQLQNILRQYYLTEVKVVDRPEDYIKDKKKPQVQESSNTDQKSAIEMEKTPAEKITDTRMNEKPMEEPKEAIKTEEIKPVEEMKPVQEMKAEISPKSNYEETKMEITQETKKDEMKLGANKESTKDEAKAEISQESVKEEKKLEAMVKEQEKAAVDTAVPQMAPIKTNVEMGEMPAEHFSGMTDSSLRIKGAESKPRMVIFNGLYYKGEWETPFVKKPADDSRVFYKSDTEKVFVSTIHSQGVYKFGSIPNLDCRAIELPYKGGRYSLLVLVPNQRNGLTKLISDLSGYSLSNVYGQLTEKLVDVCLPSFEINTISRPISSLKKLGLNKVSSIFNPETADLSGISVSDSGLYVEELVQMVTFKVDADYSKANFLTASIASSRSNVQMFQVNQPFLFYLRDNLEDIIIVNGKVIDPTPKPHFYFTK